MEENESKMAEKLKAILSRNAFACHIGMELLEANEGYARTRMRLKKEYENIYGGMHGGCAFSLADTTAGVAVVTFGEIVTTLNAAVNYMKPITDTKYLYCDARVRRHGGRVSVVGVELTNDQGELLMDGSFTYFHLRRS